MGVEVGIKIAENVKPYEPIKIEIPDCIKEHENPTISTERLWEIMSTIAEDYDLEDLQEAFGTEFIADAISMYSLEIFVELFERYEPERNKIHVGDEIEWGRPHIVKGEKPCQTGVVVAVKRPYYRVLTTGGSSYTWNSFYVTCVPIDDPSVHRTGMRFREVRFGEDDRVEEEKK